MGQGEGQCRVGDHPSVSSSLKLSLIQALGLECAGGSLGSLLKIEVTGPLEVKWERTENALLTHPSGNSSIGPL